MRKHRLHIALLGALIVFQACDATKRVPPGKRLLVRNTITVEDAALNTDDLGAILKQKPNKKVLGRPVYLWMYNMTDPAKRVARLARKDSLCEVRNAERIAKKKKTKDCTRTREALGEAPVLLDSALTSRSVEQLRLYLFKEGYFAAEVRDTTHFKPHRIWPFSGHGSRDFKKPKAEVEYVIKPGRPWSLCELDTRVDDATIAYYLNQEKDKTLLHTGDRFDSDVIDKERSRVTDVLKESGYLWFTRDMVIFTADTAAGNREVDLMMRLERPLSGKQRGLRGTTEGTQQYLDEVIVDATRHTKANKELPPDTVRLDGYTFLYKGEHPEFKPKALLNTIFLKPDERYSLSETDRTYRRLTNLRVFDRVDISFDSTGKVRPGYVDCRISLLPARKQSMAVEGFGTNRGGFLGTSLNLNYRHKNLFRSMASLQASLTLGLEAQQGFVASTGSSDASTAVAKDVLFNTIELGPEVSLSFPRPFAGLFSKSSGSRLVFNTLYNYQKRPDYTRTLAKGSVGFEWNATSTQTFGAYPMEVNVIRIPQLSNAFADFLSRTNDARLTDSYTDHMILGERLVWTLNSQQAAHRRNVFFIRLVGEHAGHMLLALPVQLFSQERIAENGTRFNTIGDVRYAQFFKFEGDLRYYRTIHERSSLAFRFAPGIGIPYGNLNVLPFETSFFSGGANGLRAWRARSLGPGSYSAPTNSFDRIGEIRLEGNAEYRFKLFGYLEGALFTDIGNIWLLRPNPAKPGGEFKTDRFLGELAIGTGIGARLNFDFFLVRFDLGIQTKDPGYPEGQRWVFQPRDVSRTFGSLLNLNLGIGYPF